MVHDQHQVTCRNARSHAGRGAAIPDEVSATEEGYESNKSESTLHAYQTLTMRVSVSVKNQWINRQTRDARACHAALLLQGLSLTRAGRASAVRRCRSSTLARAPGNKFRDSLPTYGVMCLIDCYVWPDVHWRPRIVAPMSACSRIKALQGLRQ